MRLKSFYGPNHAEAMRLVREALGENAIIVATRDDETGGIRVTAAIDDPAPPEPVAAMPLETNGNGSTVIETIASALVKHQVPGALAERLLASATQYADDDPVLALGAAFHTHFKFTPVSADASQGPLLFVGPPGAGKTLTTAKYATQQTLAKNTVAVFSADTERAGGVEQLAAFTRLLKIELMQIEDAPSLNEALDLQEPGTLVLIDTPGRNPFRDEDRDQLRPLIKACGGATLVLPADMDSSEALDMAHEFRLLGATRLLVTRLDTTRRLGGMLRTSYESRLPFANFSASTKVTEAPAPLNPISLTRLILPKAVQAEATATGTDE
ncbi:MAG: GTPase [Alphaproteobacteria bacterium]|nr:GTPase [Alphaproteobacteria bacterium]